MFVKNVILVVFFVFQIKMKLHSFVIMEVVVIISTVIMYKTVFKAYINSKEDITPKLPSNHPPLVKPPIPISYKRPQCTPQHNLASIKLHRVGGGIFHNVLVRYAMNHNAFVAIPDCACHMFFPGDIDKKSLYPEPVHPNFTGYNMFIDHARFNRTATEEILNPKPFFITQIRDPFQQAVSVYDYLKTVPNSYSFSKFLTHPEELEKKRDFPCSCTPQQRVSFTRNLNAFELGYLQAEENNITDFEAYLTKLDLDLDHVTILEQLPVSLALLRRKLCWEFKDMLHLNVDGLHKRYHLSGLALAKKKLDPDLEQKEAHRNWSSLNYMLYDHFRFKLEQEVKTQDSFFKDEVGELTRIQAKFEKFCSNICVYFFHVGMQDVQKTREIFAENYLSFPSTPLYDAFNVTFRDCVMLRQEEEISRKMLLYHMNSDACMKHPTMARDILKIHCAERMQVMPGLGASDMRFLFNLKECELMFNRRLDKDY